MEIVNIRIIKPKCIKIQKKYAKLSKNDRFLFHLSPIRYDTDNIDIADISG